MKITHYGYNAFVITSRSRKIVIDPGALFFYFFRLTPLIPESEWANATHILVTHGDPDHYWHADRVGAASNAPLICNRIMVKTVKGEDRVLGPRKKGLAFNERFPRVHPLSVGETIEVDGLKVTGLKTVHGPLTFRLGPFAKTVTPGPEERVGWGSIGLSIQLEDKTLVNLGDTLLLKEAWSAVRDPDVLMIPIGGESTGNTMDVREALEAVRIIRPKLVIPCHYNMPALFTRRGGPADDQAFKRAVEAEGCRCVILKSGESIDLE